MQWIDNELQYLDANRFPDPNLPNMPPINTSLITRIRSYASSSAPTYTSGRSARPFPSMPASIGNPDRPVPDSPPRRRTVRTRRAAANAAASAAISTATARALASSLSSALNASTELYEFDYDDRFRNDDDDDDFDVDEPFIGGLSEATVANGQLQFQPSLKIATDLMQRVEVVYVLGLFLVGKYRKRVQRKLAELRLIPGMSEVFDSFKWMCHPREGTQVPPGPAGPRFVGITMTKSDSEDDISSAGLFAIA